MKTLQVHDAVDRVVVELDRPAVRNAIDDVMAGELHEVCDALERDPRVLIITGSSSEERGVFAAGADIRTLLDRGRREALMGFNARLFGRIAALPAPVVAAVDGWAIGGGAELAYAADFRLASTRAVFGNPEVGLGILAAAGATWRLVELVGESMAKEVLMAGRRLTAAEALDRGLVISVHEPDDLLPAAQALADRIAEQDPLAVQLTKRVMRAPREAHPLVDDLAQAVLFETDERRSRMTAFLEKRKA